MIKPENICTLLPASEVCTIATNASEELSEMGVAKAINLNANNGEWRTEYNGEISDKLLEKLNHLGYKVKPKYDVNNCAIPNMYIISSR